MSKNFPNMANFVGQCSKDSLKSNTLTTAAVTLVFSLVFFPVFLCTLLIWLPVRLLIIAFVIRQHPELEPVATGAGTVMALRVTGGRPDANIVFCLICRGEVSLNQLRNQFYHKVLEYTDPEGQKSYRRLRYFFQPFFQVVCWKEDLQFDLKNHIRLYDLNEPELTLPKDSVTEDDLMRVTGPLTTRPYTPGRSPWELLLIKNVKGKSGENLTVITLRIHHGLADGLSCIGLVHRLFGASPPPPLAKFSQLTLIGRIFRALFVIFRAPYELARLALHFNDEFSAWKLPRTNYSAGVVSWCSERIPWSEVKRIMVKFDVNSNAAVYSIIAGALVRLMKQAGQQVPSKLSIFIPWPIPNHPGGLCNHWSFGFFGFKPHTHIGPALVLQVGSQVKAAHYFNPIPAVAEGMMNPMSLFPNFISKRVPPITTTSLFTHVPGPLRELHDTHFATLVDIIPATDSGAFGSVAVAMSTAGYLRIGLTVNKDMLPRQDEGILRIFAKNVADEIEALLSDNIATSLDTISC